MCFIWNVFKHAAKRILVTLHFTLKTSLSCTVLNWCLCWCCSPKSKHELSVWRPEVSRSHAEHAGATSDPTVGLIYWCFLATCGGRMQTMFTPSLKELIRSVFSGQWLSSDVKGRAAKLWMKSHSLWSTRTMQIIHPPLPWKPLLSGGGFHTSGMKTVLLRSVK